MRGTSAKSIRRVLAEVNKLGLPKRISYRKLKTRWKLTPGPLRNAMLNHFHLSAVRAADALEKKYVESVRS